MGLIKIVIIVAVLSAHWNAKWLLVFSVTSYKDNYDWAEQICKNFSKFRKISRQLTDRAEGFCRTLEGRWALGDCGNSVLIFVWKHYKKVSGHVSAVWVFFFFVDLSFYCLPFNYFIFQIFIFCPFFIFIFWIFMVGFKFLVDEISFKWTVFSSFIQKAHFYTYCIFFICANKYALWNCFIHEFVRLSLLFSQWTNLNQIGGMNSYDHGILQF